MCERRRGDFHRYVQAASRLGPLEGNLRMDRTGVVRGNRELFEKHFGDDYATMEKRIIGHLNHQTYIDPFAGSPHFVAKITVPLTGRTLRDANIFRTEQLAKKWQRETIAALPENIRETAKPSIERAKNKAAAQERAIKFVRGG